MSPSKSRRPDFLALAREWRAVADALRRRRGVPEADPALSVWREAAFCHALFAAGRGHAALTALRAALRRMTGVPVPWSPPPTTQAAVVSAAAALFDRLRAAASESGRPAA